MANSQITASPTVPLGFGVIVRAVAPAVPFLAYQMSAVPVLAMALAFPACAYALPTLSATPLVVAFEPGPEDQATTIRFPAAVAGMVQVVGNAAAPQDVMWTKLTGVQFDNAMLLPPAGAGLFRVTVQELSALGPRLVGLQANEETTVADTRLIVAGAELPLYVAVTVAVWSLVMLEVVALKLAVVAFAVTVTDAGTVNAA